MFQWLCVRSVLPWIPERRTSLAMIGPGFGGCAWCGLRLATPGVSACTVRIYLRLTIKNGICVLLRRYTERRSATSDLLIRLRVILMPDGLV